MLKAQQTRVVYGKVTVLNNLPVSGIEIKAVKAATSALTDSTGHFSIVCNEKDRLKFTSKSFRYTSVKINSKTQDSVFVKMNFMANEENIQHAIGYGYINEKYKTQAVQSATKGQNFSNYQSIYDIIKQNFNNIVVDNNGCVIIRGPMTINGHNCALFIVNGSKVDNIDYISPTDVKEISMIKDGSSSIYGNEGATGVILINLKDGK